MQFVNSGADVTTLEKGVKNKWRWAWLEDTGRDGKPFGNWCKKLGIPGACYCTLCSRKIIYGSSGKKVLRKHELDLGHQAAVRAVPHTTRLPGATATAAVPTSITDRVCELKIRVCAFLAEHDLSFTLAQPLVDLCKKVAGDKAALSRVSMSNQLASYFNTHGITPEFKRQLSNKLKNNMFSLNVDEATNNNMDKVLNVLVRYFDTEENAVTTQHLSSRKLGPSTSSSRLSSTTSSGLSTSSSSGQPKLFSLFYGPAKKSTATASTTSGKRKSSDDSAPSKKWKK